MQLFKLKTMLEAYGIMTQNNINFQVSVVNIHNQTITISISLGGSSRSCTALYVCHNAIHHRTLWQYLVSLNANISGPWFLIGDFNEMISPSEQRGIYFQSKRAK